MVHNIIPIIKKDRMNSKDPKDVQVNVCKADNDIYPNIQKTITMYTDIYVKRLTCNTPIIRSILKVVNPFWLAWKTLTTKEWTENFAINIAASNIRDYMKDMYQGNMTIIGDASVKPYDAMYISDAYNEMFGAALVKQVVHQFSLDTGFITDVSPDCAAAVIDDEFMDIIMWGASVAAGVGIGWGLSSAVSSTWRAGILFKIGGALNWLSKGGNYLTNSINNGILGTNQIAYSTMNVTKTATTTLSGVSSATYEQAYRQLFGVPVAGWVAIAVMAACTFATKFALQAFDKAARASQCVVLSLLTYRGEEFSAGILGHNGLTVGSIASAQNRTFWGRIISVLPAFAKSWFNADDPPINPSAIFGNQSAFMGDDLTAITTEVQLIPQNAKRYVIQDCRHVDANGNPKGIDNTNIVNGSIKAKVVINTNNGIQSPQVKSYTGKLVWNEKLYKIKTTKMNKILLAIMIKCEAEGEPTEELLAVGRVIFNRASRLGQSIAKVISTPGQFEPWFRPVGKTRFVTIAAQEIEEIYLWAAELVLRGEQPECFEGKRYWFFNNPTISESGPAAAHAKGKDPLVIGRQVFHTTIG
jgi:hypothetical protein